MDMRATGEERAAGQRAAQPRTDRKHDILLAAERLFAQHGYHAVSIRQIAEAAQVPLALVGYYWGQKHELFGAIFEHWRPTIKERLAGLDAAKRVAPPADRVRCILSAFIAPVLRLRASSEGEWYALLVARELHQPNRETDRILRQHFDPLAHAFIDALHDALPGATRGRIAWCYQFALGALLLHIGDDRVERLSRGANRAADPSAAEPLLDFLVGGVRAATAEKPEHNTRKTRRPTR